MDTRRALIFADANVGVNHYVDLLKEVELQVLVVGLDDILMQTVHAQHRYFTDQIVWGARHADVLSETPDGHLMLDLTKFHHVEQTPPTAEFPYPETSTAAKAE